MEFPFASSLRSILAATMLIIYFSYKLSQKWRRWENTKLKLAPSPPGAWPIIGHLHFLHKVKLPHITLGAMSDKYGPIFRLQLGWRSALVVSNWEMAKEILCTNDSAVASRPEFIATPYFSFDSALFGFAPYGPYWREMRKISHLLLLSNRRVEQLKNTMFFEVDTWLRELYKNNWGSNSKRNESNHTQALIEMKRTFEDVVMNIILKIIIGKRCVGSKAEGCEKEAKELQKAINDSFHIVGHPLLGDYIPIFGWLDLDGKLNKMKKIAKDFDKILEVWLKEHKLKKVSSINLRADDEPEEDRDFMNALLSLLDGKEFAGYDSDQIVKGTTFNMITGGTESSTVSLTWIISVLLNNPESMKRAQQELDDVVGRNRRVNESDITKLVYMQAVVKETMRLHPVSPLPGPREFHKDCYVAGYFVPKGTQLITNAWKIQTDPRVWSDPMKFNPERFLTTHKSVDLRGNNFELIPFGSGRRACPGISFGLQVLHFILAGFLQSFEIKNSSDLPVDMSEKFGFANEKVIPLNVLLTPRLPSYLYE